MKKSLTKRERISSKAELKSIISSKKKVSCNGLTLRFAENALSWNRIVVVAAKQVGNSVKRNREKRVVRECYRNLKHAMKPGYDMMFVLYPGEYNYDQRREQMSRTCKAAGLLEKCCSADK